jgi:hypothetical protein
MSQPIVDEAKYKDAKYIVITDFDGTITLLVSHTSTSDRAICNDPHH